MKKVLIFSVYLIGTMLFLLLLEFSTIQCFYITLFAMMGVFLVDVIIDREWMKPLLWSCAWYFLLFMFYICLGNVHICQTDEGKIEVYSPLYTRTLITEATAADTLILNSSLERCYSDVSAKQEEFYFVYKDGMAHIFNRMNEIMVVDKKELSLSRKSWQGITIDVLKVRENYWDLNGKLIDEDWRPYISDVTPVDPNI